MSIYIKKKRGKFMNLMNKKLIVAIAAGCLVALLAFLFLDKGDIKEGDASKYVKVGKYKGLEIEKVDPIKVTDEDVEAAIRTDLQTLKQSVSVSGPAKKGDTVVMNYVGKIDGVAFDGGTADDASLTLGSNTFIDGFEDAIVGHSVGETFDINVTFPEDYGNELAGQDAVFTITLKQIDRLPELTDDLVAKLDPTVKTVKEYKAKVKKDLEESNKETADASNQQLALEALVKVCKFKKYPTSSLIRVTKELVYQESYGAIMNSLSIDAAVEQSKGKNVEEAAKEILLKEMAVEIIAEKEDIIVSEEEYTEQCTEMAMMYGETDVAGFVKSYETIYGEGYIKRMMLQEKVGAFLVKHATEKKSK